MFVKLALLCLLPFAVLAQNCRDDPDFGWTNTHNGEVFNLNCAFLTNGNTEQENQRRQNNWCDKRANGRLIRNACRRSCDNCGGGNNDGGGNNGCQNSPTNFQDGDGNNCGWYAHNTNRCNNWNTGTNRRTPRQACCACGGGNRNNNNNNNNNGGCQDNRNWRSTWDSPGNSADRTCDWFTNDRSRCNSFGWIMNNNGELAREACCACGGGSNNNNNNNGCRDDLDWTSSSRTSNQNARFRTCAWFNNNSSRCNQFGRITNNNGKTARQACCVCRNNNNNNNNPGICTNNNNWRARSYNNNHPFSNASNRGCNWFNRDRCNRFPVQGTNNRSVWTACCISCRNNAEGDLEEPLVEGEEEEVSVADVAEDLGDVEAVEVE